MLNKQTAEKISFWNLLQSNKIEIPIIQRDYAQGRLEQEKIRERFLNALYISLSEEKSIELDFVYGSQVDDTLQLLDGQQRLTTLFLLHFYFVNKDHVDNITKNKLLNFTYETRISSREFCESLINDVFDITNLDDSTRISELITDKPWFFLSWQQDPTIAAMLNMLDAIHAKFYDIKNGWSKLTERNVIQFYHLNLDNFGLSDDLYITMNARGKALTAFENFKALLEKQINEEGWEDKDTEFNQKFAYKIDNQWTDLLWSYRNKENSIDEYFLQLISNLYLVNKRELDNVQILATNPSTLISISFDKSTLEYLVKSLDNYSSADLNLISNQLSNLNFLNFKDLKSDLVFNNFFELISTSSHVTYPQRVMFYAQTCYLNAELDFTSVKFLDWMRVIRNIVNNSTIDNDESFLSALNLVRELARGQDNIYQYLEKNVISSKFAAKQIDEEIIKAKLINESQENKNAIHKLEDSQFCRGSIGIFLDCLDEFSFEKLNILRKNIVQKYLNDRDISNDFRRALLTIGDNKFYNYWWSILHAVSAPKRCLIANTEDLKFLFNRDPSYLKELFIVLMDKDLEEVIDDYELPVDMPNWKQRLIKEPNLLDYSKHHYLAIKEDESCCWLIPQSRVANNDAGRTRCRLIV
ncbi:MULTISPECIES: DUF262 domain-containing protein [Acinetobacter]|uniref:DUF262 domain-containing protein n=2 Tax=Acinetobacter TaxID=469 RepID=A0AAE6WWN1_9GAMM|nr:MULTISPECIES: DUF262 domain-containing protein [Acinetobacter]QIC67624.1 DUF262 domain-containing protein [Acinetobacter schindleri]